VGPARFFVGIPDARLEMHRLMLQVLKESPAPSATIRQAAGADAVLVLGEDAWNTAPILALNLRQAAANAPAAAAMKQKKLNRWDDAAMREAIRYEKGPFFVASVEATKLDEVARECLRAAPADIARLGFAVAHEIDPASPAVAGLAEPAQAAAHRIAEALRAAEHPLVVSGGSLSSPEIVQAAANVARALKKAGRDALISLVFPEANSVGAAILATGGIESAGRALAAQPGSALIVLEADLHREMDAAAAQALLSSAAHIIAVDHTAHETTAAAEIVLPAATYAESSGTLISSEGRAQRFFSVMPAVGTMTDSWRWVERIAVAAGRKARAWVGLDEVIQALIAEIPELRGVRDAAPGADYRLNGARVPRKSIRESGRTAVTAHLDIHEPRPPVDRDSPLAYSMEGASRGAPSSLNARFWSPGWNSDQSLSKFQAEVSGQLVGGDPGVRLIEPPASDAGSWFTSIPAAHAARDGKVFLVPRYHVFGSEELSSLAPGVAARSTGPCIALSAADAKTRGLANGQKTRALLENGAGAELTVQIGEMPPGIASITAGTEESAGFRLPSWARVTGGIG
jgi:NADH-quinone oxidoreductase subunit G